MLTKSNRPARNRIATALASVLLLFTLVSPNRAFCKDLLQSQAIDLSHLGSAAQPSVAPLNQAGFVVSYQSRASQQAQLNYLRVSAAGIASRPARITQGEKWFVNWADFPSLLELNNGDWVTFWLPKSGDLPYAYDIQLSRSADSGKSWANSIKPHRDQTQTEHGFVSMLAWQQDQVLLAWLDGRNTQASAGHADHGSGGAMTLRSAMIDTKGRLSQEFELDAKTCDCCQTDMAKITDGAVLVYRDRDENEIRDISLMRWDGTKWHGPSVVANDLWHMPACPVNGPAVAAREKTVAVAWYTAAQNKPRVQLAVSSDSGAHFSKPVIVTETDALGRVDIAAFGKDQWLVTWMEEDDTAISVKLALYDANLKLTETHVMAQVARGRASGFPRMAVSGEKALLVWTQTVDGKPALAGRMIGLVDRSN